MALYIDSADQPAVESLLATGLFSGIATNPTLIARAGLTTADRADIVRWATAAGAGTVFIQALGTTVDDIAHDGRSIAALGSNVVVKIAATRAGFQATKQLTSDGIPVLTTAVYHATQAMLALGAGASWIAPYVGRMTDQGRDGIAQAVKIAKIAEGHDLRVLTASLRTADDVAELAAAGVSDFVINTELLELMLADELSGQAARDFEDIATGR